MTRARRRPLSASIVITLGGLTACRSSAPAVERPIEPAVDRPAAPAVAAMIVALPSGHCGYRPPTGPCPPNVACNPPPFATIDCPDAAVTPPPDRAGWLRVRPAFYAPATGACAFTPERWCPPTSAASCDPPHDLSVPCTHENADVAVAAFTYEVAAGRCARAPAFRCTAGRPCEVPATEPAPCDANTLR